MIYLLIIFVYLILPCEQFHYCDTCQQMKMEASNCHRPNHNTTKTVVGMRLIHCWESPRNQKSKLHENEYSAICRKQKLLIAAKIITNRQRKWHGHYISCWSQLNIQWRQYKIVLHMHLVVQRNKNWVSLSFVNPIFTFRDRPIYWFANVLADTNISVFVISVWDL